MDKTLLREWQSELEANLVSVEKQISGLELERQKIKAQLGAIATLLPPTEGEIINQVSPVATASEADSISDFLLKLKKEGWSITPKKGKRQSYIASRKGQSFYLWFKFSRLYENGRYWLGINPNTLEEMSKEKGGVISKGKGVYIYSC